MRVRLVAFLTSLALLVLATATSALAGTRNSGYYDHQVIEYEGTVVTADSIQAAQQLAHGNVVYHIVDPATGKPPRVQCVANTAAFPNDATDCNVLNFIPSEVGYAGGAWNLQIFTWKAGVVPVALTKDDDILAARDAGLGTLTITKILVRCPVVNFANLR